VWKLYKENKYIQGELISSHKTEELARKKAKEVIGHSYTVKEEDKKEIRICLEEKERMPMGKLLKQRKRGRNGFDKVKENKKCKQVRYDLNSSNSISANNNVHFESIALAA